MPFKPFGEREKAGLTGNVIMAGLRKKFAEIGLEPIGNTPAEFLAAIKKETPEWGKLIKDAGIKLNN